MIHSPDEAGSGAPIGDVARPRREAMPVLWTVVLLLAATLTLCWGQLTQPAISRGDDIIFHAQCTEGFAAALSEGVLYPRWIANVNRGLGAPVFVIYPPLGHYLLGATALALDDVFSALRVTPVVILFLSGLSFWIAVRGRTTPVGAAAASVLYVVLPYHVLDFVWRYAWAELVAFVWLPPLFLSVRALVLRSGRGAWLALALSSAALLWTHVATATLLPLVLGPYALAYLLRSRCWRGLWRIASAGGVALLLAAVYLVPFLARQHEVHLDWAFGEWFDWRRNFVFRDETSLGFERDHTKPMVTLAVASQAVLALGATLVLAWHGRRARRSRRTVDRGPSGTGSRSFDGWIAAGLAAWSIYLQTPLSTPVWLALPFLGTVQFPWRFGIFQVLLTALLCAAVLGAARGRRQTTAALLVIAAGALPSLVVSQKLLPEPPSFDRAFMQDDDYHSVVAKEYVPHSVSGWRWLREPLPAGITKVEHGKVEILRWQTHVRQLRIDASRTTRVRVGTFAFPGWQVRVDGRSVPRIDADLITFEVPAGRHDVEVAFEPTWDRRLGAATSALTAVALGIAVVARRRRGKPAGSTTVSPREPSA